MAEANKAEAHELFGDGNIMHAADRYAKAMGHCQKVMGDMSPEQETRLRDLKGTLSLNLAQCFFKLERFQKSVEHCNEALRYSPDLTRATLRRGLALEQLKKWEEALADAEGVLAEDPESGPAAKLRARVQERIAAQEANARKMFQKMF
jgi:tetratricopeptide (TPR) repeat protein